MDAQTERLSQVGQPRRAAIGRADWLFFIALGCITLIGLAARIYVGSRNFLDLDEWQHVFISASPRLADLDYELKDVAHPPFFFWILRALFHFGHSTLIYRLPSILAGTASVCLIGLICRRVFRNHALALVAALAFALSSVALTIAAEVRSYETALCFVLFAFFCYLELLSPRGDKPRLRTYAAFSVAMCLALESEYFSIFVLGACAAATILFALINPKLRSRMIGAGNGGELWLFALALGLPFGLMLTMYLGPLRHQPIQGYLYSYYWGFTPGESKSDFLIRNLFSEWNWFSPISVHSPSTALAVVGIMITISGLLWVVSFRRSSSDLLALLPVPFFLLLLLQIVILSIERAYPFGGLLRQQYIIAPFVIIVLFYLVDVVAGSRHPAIRKGIPIVAAFFVLLNARVTARTVVVNPGLVINKADFDAFEIAFPNAAAVYLNHFTVIQYFESTDAQPRRFVRRISDPTWIDEFRMGSPGERPTELFYDKDRYIPDLTDPALYRSFAACLKQAGIPELTLFHIVPGGLPLPQPAAVLKNTIVQKAAAAGLVVDKIEINETSQSVFAGFRLKSP